MGEIVGQRRIYFRKLQIVLARDLVRTESKSFMPDDNVFDRDPSPRDTGLTTQHIRSGFDMLIEGFCRHEAKYVRVYARVFGEPMKREVVASARSTPEFMGLPESLKDAEVELELHYCKAIRRRLQIRPDPARS